MVTIWIQLPVSTLLIHFIEKSPLVVEKDDRGIYS